MPRVTKEDIDAIIEVDANIKDYSPFILAANLLVNDYIASPDVDASRLKEIERWLAAHFLAIRDPRPDNEKAGSVGIKYQYQVGLNLSVTTYGQQAMVLDPTGNLSKINSGKSAKKKVASVTVIRASKRSRR